MLNYPASIARVFFLVLAVLSAHSVWAATNPAATSKAFDALLSLPQTQPEEGQWDHAVPEGFEGEDETTLIRWLTRQQKAGADFNQVRHQGTLLHHAIRGGLDATALWLLAHGANPLKTLEGEQTDALVLSVRYRRWPVLNALLKVPGVTAPNRALQLQLAWQAAQGENERIVVDKLLAQKLPLPQGKAGEYLLKVALEQQWMGLARVLINAGTTHAIPSAYGWRTTAHKIGAVADIEFADARLAAPIFPYLIAHVANTADVASLWQLRIRRPFEDATFTRQVVLRILDAPSTPQTKRALLEHLPPKSLRAALEDSEVIDRWVRWSARLPSAEGDWAFMALGDLPTQRPAVLFDAMLKNAYWFDENSPDSKQLAAGWGRLLGRLQTPLPGETHGKLWMLVPRQHRPTLLNLGYRPSDKELASWLERDNKDAVLALWPHIKATVPALSGRIHEALFAPYSPENGCSWSGVRAETLEKAHILLEAGAKPGKSIVLDAGCAALTDPAILNSLKTAGLIEYQTPSPAEMRRFIPEKLACHFQPNGVWRRSLLQVRSLGDIPVEGIQMIAIRGETNCALLAWGGNAGGRVFIDEDSFTGTQRLTPCADGHHASAILRMVGDTVQPIQLGEDMPAIQGALPLRDTVNGEHLLLVGQIGTGTCGVGTPPELLGWDKTQNTKAALHVLPRKSAAMQAFLRQCGKPTEADSQNCFPPGGDAGESSFNFSSFVDTQWASERKAYLDAVLALDYDALRTAKKTGIFPHWTAQAIDTVTKADMPVADKRRRTARLFRDAVLLANALQTDTSYETLTGLVAWLPREDWQPVIKALKGNDSMLNILRGESEQQNKHALACRFATALGHACRRSER